MKYPAYCRAGVLAASLLALTGCTSLPQQTTADSAGTAHTADATTGWQVAPQPPSVDARAPSGSAGRLRDLVRLGEITVAHDADSLADNDALDDLRSALAEQLRHGLTAPDAAVVTLNVRLQEATPVSPVANVITGALLFVPLDTGSIVVEAELLSPNGEPIATRRERLHGDYLDIGASLSRWGRIRNALEKWAQRCLDETVPASAHSSNVS